MVKVDDDVISKAKALGMAPQTVIANYRSTKQEKWKTSTKQWIEELYAQKNRKSI